MATELLPLITFAIGVTLTASILFSLGSIYRVVSMTFTLFRILATYRFRGQSDETHKRCAKLLADQLCNFGGLWAKCGQFATMRGDLLPDAYLIELSRCQDSLPQRSFQEVKRTIEEELDCKLEQVFEYVDETCISSATIAQVHRGRLRHGPVEERDVAIKVQHRDIHAKIMHDLQMITLLNRVVKFFFPHLNVVRVLSCYLQLTPRELNFSQEAESMKAIAKLLAPQKKLRPGFLSSFTRPMREWDFEFVRPGTEVLLAFDPENPSVGFVPGRIVSRVGNTDNFRATFSGSEHIIIRNLDDILLQGDEMYIDIRIPRPVDRLVTNKLLVMSYEKGSAAKRTDIMGQSLEHISNQTIMLIRAFTFMMFFGGHLHGDPHPANVLFDKGDAPALVDFGLCLVIPDQVRRGWAKVVYGFTQLNYDIMVEGYRDLGFQCLPGCNKSEVEQMMDVSFKFFGREKRKLVSSIDRTGLLRMIMAHKIDSDAILFVMRVSNYVGELSSKIDLRVGASVYPIIAEKALVQNNWIKPFLD